MISLTPFPYFRFASDDTVVASSAFGVSYDDISFLFSDPLYISLVDSGIGYSDMTQGKNCINYRNDNVPVIQQGAL